MKRFTLCMACVAILASVAEARTWTSARGKTIEAEFVSIDRDGVVVKNTAGKLYRVPYNKLSQADQIAAHGLAVDKATTMIETDPKNGKAFSMRALAYSKQGEYDKAMDDFGRAVRYSPDDPSALKNRGDALMDLHKGKNAKLRAYAEKFKEKERKKTSAVHKKYIGDRRLIAQPENSTTGDVFPGLYAMAQADFKAAKRLRYKGYGINGGGYGIGYGGYGGGGGGGVGYGGGVGVGVGYGKGKGVAADQGVMVFPEQAPQGTELTLVANAKQLSNGMPYKIDPETGRRAKGKKGQRYGMKEDIKGVEFYRDVNGNGKLDGDDLKIGEDADGETNGQYTAKVSSDLFPVGTQSYFAVPKGAEGTDKKAYKSKASDEDKKAKAQGKPAGGQGEITPGSPAVAKAPGKGGPGKGDDGKGDGGDGDGGDDDGGNGGDGDRDYDGDDDDTVVIRDRDDDDRDVVYVDDDDDDVIVIDDDDDRDLVVDRNVRYIEDGDYNGAIRGYTQVIDYKNDDPRYYVGRANAYRAVGDYSSAIVDYDAAIKLQPKNADFYYNRGLAYRNEGKLDLAIADYLKSISLDETLSKAYNNLASVYGVKGDYASAVKYATIAVDRNSSDALAFFNRGLAYFKMGEHDKAIKDLSVVINLTPNDPFPYAYRSQSYNKIGETTKAKADMVKAKALSPALGG